ncbi:MAG: Amidase, partial [bacterium]
EPFRGQVPREDATVIQRLTEAGAVLVAKTAVGALAYGDVWFGGTTKNPWKLDQGSSGSSAGSSSGTAAGLFAFAIGTETLGSIVSPCTRCGTTGLRPTFGRVSRQGAMALSWSMDKIGPIARSVGDLALVFDAIHGADGRDASVHDAPFNADIDAQVPDWTRLRIGYDKGAFDEARDEKGFDDEVLATMRRLGVNLVPMTFPDLPVNDTLLLLECEAAAAFDELTRTNQDEQLKRQTAQAWPNIFRTARLIPAVEYIQANRIRTLLIRQFDRSMADVDVYLSPTFGGISLRATNLTGHPCVVLPSGFRADGTPASVTFIGRLFGEEALLAVSRAYQEATGWHRRRPPGFA